MRCLTQLQGLRAARTSAIHTAELLLRRPDGDVHTRRDLLEGSTLIEDHHACRASGQLEIYQLPYMRLVFSCGGLGEGPLLLSPVANADAAPASDSRPADVAELRLESFPEASTTGGNGGGGGIAGSGGDLGVVGAAPHLLTRLEDGTLLVYHAFAPQQASKVLKGDSEI